MLDSSCQFFLRLSNKKWNGLTCFPRLTDQVFPGMDLLPLVSDLSLLGAVGPQLRVEVLTASAPLSERSVKLKEN